MTNTNPTRGRGWAKTGAALGALVSVAANVAHSFIPPAGHVGPWAPEPGAVVISIVWPVFLFIAIEILVRTPWPRQFGWTATRWVGLLPVALVAAFVSYRHLSGLLAHYGEEPIVTVLGPLAVDGLMIMATAAILATSHRTTNAQDPVTATVSAAPQPTTSVDSTPAPTTVPAPVVEPTPVVVPQPQPVPTPAELATRITAPRPASGPRPAPAPDQAARNQRTRQTSTTTTPATLAPSATDFSVTGPDAAQPALPIVSAEDIARARRIADQYQVEHGTPITTGRLAVRMQVGTEYAAQLLAAVANADPTSSTRPVNGTRIEASTR
ncbi:DUF2637 domain-containing protein [Luedemannella helvata]|uniref:DUF2637 domain-containing protein n=1 Tax=Luedemannella helvata TaxID=349315 RepID=A0ABN2L2Z6_9ACTN